MFFFFFFPWISLLKLGFSCSSIWTVWGSLSHRSKKFCSSFTNTTESQKSICINADPNGLYEIPVFCPPPFCISVIENANQYKWTSVRPFSLAGAELAWAARLKSVTTQATLSQCPSCVSAQEVMLPAGLLCFFLSHTLQQRACRSWVLWLICLNSSKRHVLFFLLANWKLCCKVLPQSEIGPTHLNLLFTVPVLTVRKSLKQSKFNKLFLY